MDVSVVICTRNRAERLHEMLAKLHDLKAPGLTWELILVDNNSRDATLGILKEFCLNFPVPTQVIHEPKDGLSNARNAGWRAARGKIVSFTDDDCYPQDDWLVSIVQSFRESDAAYIGGRVLLFDPEDAPITIQTSTQSVDFPANSHIESGQIIGANFSYKREVLEALGGFDTRLGAGTPFHSGEDTDLLIRASQSGLVGRYDPSIVVFHHHRRRIDSDIEKLYRGYAYGRGALSMKTIIESNTKRKHIKHWYWNLRSLIKARKFNYVMDELRGASSFAWNQWFHAEEPVSKKDKPSRLEITNFEIGARGSDPDMGTAFESKP